ncbi:hypothetical protein H6P81_002655 [Aristolochia fimbriata]|uniref:Reverse transcriptase RNase H-like domain-containing protein n=1 Tax=Aristolochia fimbriata TaxID=158543 RepID=A0AAV7FEH2_ARIFI|nr:hypothetical protein H6P81_002655 [Aristolochia fimbriata]
MVGAELNYSPIEKMCLALIFAIQKLRHYLLAHSTNLISRADPLKFIMSRPMLSGRLAKWALLLSEFEINFIPQKAIKGQGLANFLADHPIPAEWEIIGDFEVRKDELVPYQKEAQRLLEKIPNATLGHVPRASNTQADALAGIAASLAQFDARPERIPICERWVVPTLEKFSTKEEINLVSVYTIEEEDWRQQFFDYLEHKKLPEELKARAYVRRVAPKFCLFNNTLYRRSYDGILLRCVSKEEGQALLSEAHGGICGAHQAGPKLHLQVKQLGYYWPTMLWDAIELARHRTACQLHANYIHQPPSPLHPTRASPAIRSPGNGHHRSNQPKVVAQITKYIPAPTDYFSKWAKQQLTKKSKLPPWSISFDANCVSDLHQHTTLLPTDWPKPSTRLVQNLKEDKSAGNKKDWHDRLGEALWAYRDHIPNSNRVNPVLTSLRHGSRAPTGNSNSIAAKLLFKKDSRKRKISDSRKN